MDIDTLFWLVCIGNAAAFLAAVSAIIAVVSFAFFAASQSDERPNTVLLKCSLAFAILFVLSAAVAAGMPSMQDVKAYLSIKKGEITEKGGNE